MKDLKELIVILIAEKGSDAYTAVLPPQACGILGAEETWSNHMMWNLVLRIYEK